MTEPPPRKPLALYRAHRVLIGAGIFCSLVLTLFEVRMFRAKGQTMPLVLALCGIVAAVGLVGYLRYFNRKISR